VKRDLISTLLVIDGPEDSSIFPQVGINSASARFQDVYWRCVACFFASSVRFNPDADHILFTTASHAPVVDGTDLTKYFHELNVKIVTLPITKRLGIDRVKMWNNVFYILDVINYLDKKTNFERMVVLDTDCIWVRSGEGFFSDLMRRGILTMSIPYAPDEQLNGASREDMIKASIKLADINIDFVPNFTGGELFAITRSRITELNVLLTKLWAKLSEAEGKVVNVYTEEHLLSLAYELLDIPTGTGDPHIRRMWTAIRLNNVTAEDLNSGRCIWHLPMEKKTGFKVLYASVTNSDSWFWNTPKQDLRAKIARVFGVPNKTPLQWINQFRERLLFLTSKELKRLLKK
jgi:hypothetical protein